jgi:predicted phosphodiesterase
MKDIQWLHLSDWHEKGSEFDRGVVRDALIRDIRERERISAALVRIDFVIFSGDLAFSGKAEEYEAAREHLLDPVMESIGLGRDRLFLVPGNHDLSRETVTDMLPTELQKPLDSDFLVQRWLDPKRLSRTLEPFNDFCAFVEKYTQQPSPAYASIVEFDINGTKVALLGLNSAWMSGRNKDAKGKLNDYGFTLIGEPQIHNALTQISKADLRIAVVHHPFDWMSEFDRHHTEARLGRECHFILRGHEHNPQVRFISGTEGDCVIIPGGASYDRRIASNPRYVNSYNWVHLDLAAEEGTVYLRRWSDQRNAWIPDTDTHESGEFHLRQFAKGSLKKKVSGLVPR